ncbi:heat stress transcription factor A-5 [Musa acuminata AAA Group]|uniref:heat stress transcription factor A-5 n=1 Tax=Musa acuminata AAA Group TaxID=214697 RepID=UPI0031D34E67
METEVGEHGGSAGGPAPFLLKTYEMVDDASTNDVVSWSPSMNSFVVWNPPDFAAHLLPTYFKHNNFSSFIRQLNTYGFRKIDSERWEFANEDFIKGQKHLLKNIYRRKPIHSHSRPPGGGLADSERIALEEEIDRLKREKASLQMAVQKFEQLHSGTKIQLGDVERRVADMEKRQLKMVAFLQRVMQNPRLMENLVKMVSSSSIDFSVIHKKRRLPLGADHCQENSENSLCDDHCSTSKFEFGHALNQDFCDKLRLELCSAYLDSNVVMASTQSSNEDTCSSRPKQINRSHCTIESLTLAPETLELCDTGASICPTKNLLFPKTADDGDGIFPCHLSLTLASSAMQIDRSDYSSRIPDAVNQEEANSTEMNNIVTTKENELNTLISAGARAAPLQEAPTTSNETPAVPAVRVNDMFWEQFLTERPGSSDNEEASSGLRAYPRGEQNEERHRK